MLLEVFVYFYYWHFVSCSNQLGILCWKCIMMFVYVVLVLASQKNLRLCCSVLKVVVCLMLMFWHHSGVYAPDVNKIQLCWVCCPGSLSAGTAWAVPGTPGHSSRTTTLSAACYSGYWAGTTTNTGVFTATARRAATPYGEHGIWCGESIVLHHLMVTDEKSDCTETLWLLSPCQFLIVTLRSVKR
jgi:hypothetical protein